MPAPLVTYFPASHISLQVTGVTIKRKLARSIQDLVSRTRQLLSFQRRYGWTAPQFDRLDWPLFRSSVSSFMLEKRFFFLKWLNDLLPVQARMHQYGHPSLAGCPDECGRTSEDQLHLLRCTPPSRMEVLGSMIADVSRGSRLGRASCSASTP
jgi:hypothetical protein